MLDLHRLCRDMSKPKSPLRREAAARGVRVCAWDCTVAPDRIAIRRPVPVIL